jgi:hypothetical protein
MLRRFETMIKLFPSRVVVQREDDVPLASPIAEGVDEFAVEYDKLAAELGVNCYMGATAQRQRLLGVIRSLCIPVFPLDKVEAYLDSKGNWGWFPLRDSDRASDKKTWIINRNDHKAPGLRFGYVSNQRYDSPVPFPVLKTVKDINDGLPGSGENARAIFMVAALKKNPDPFLGVRLLNDPDRRMIVVERWDEPGFRG